MTHMPAYTLFSEARHNSMNHLVFMCIVRLASCQTIPHGPDLSQSMEMVFNLLDGNHDDFVTETEFNEIQTRGDENNDGCVTLDEYSSHYSYLPTDVAVHLFNNFDHDDDECLRANDMQTEFLVVDKNLDGHLDVHEYVDYYTNLLNSLMGPHGH